MFFHLELFELEKILGSRLILSIGLVVCIFEGHGLV